MSKYEDLNKPSAWAPDELILDNLEEPETKPEREKRIKKLYKEKIELITLRTQKYSNRPLTYHVFYPDKIIGYFKENGCDIETETEVDEKFQSMEDFNHPYERQIGVRLKKPQSRKLVKLSPKDFLKRFSVPLVKIGKVYKCIRELMKQNGLILSKA